MVANVFVEIDGKRYAVEGNDNHPLDTAIKCCYSCTKYFISDADVVCARCKIYAQKQYLTIVNFDEKSKHKKIFYCSDFSINTNGTRMYTKAEKFEAVNLRSAKLFVSKKFNLYNRLMISDTVNHDGFILEPICVKINGKWITTSNGFRSKPITNIEAIARWNNILEEYKVMQSELKLTFNKFSR